MKMVCPYGYIDFCDYKFSDEAGDMQMIFLRKGWRYVVFYFVKHRDF